MVPAKPIAASLVAAVALVVALAGCGKPPPPAAEPASPETSYLAPPRVEAVRATPSGLVLFGQATAGGKVRLASPTGQALFAAADARGRWTLVLPSAAEPLIFGLSVAAAGRQAQADGYLLVTPAGQGALLRAGAGAERIDRSGRPGLRAIDFDNGGGLVVSAAVPPAATVILRLDGREVALGRADARGRYEMSLGSPPNPVKPGLHRIEVSGDGFSDATAAQISPAAPLADGPLRRQLTPAGLRVDWLTPGGGVQSTLLIH